MENIITSASGVNGQIEVYDNKLIIKRKGLLAFATQGFKGDKEIFINQISSVQLKKADWLSNGYLQFAFMGGQEAKGGIFQATSDENTIMFNASQQNDFEKVKSAIESVILKLTNKNQQSLSTADEIKKFAKLKEDGIITEDEFQKKKKDLLGL